MSVQTMAAVWKGSQHGGSALLMLLAIADFADDKGAAYPAVSTLAEKTRMKPRNANYLLSELQDSGELVIKIGAGPRGTNLYRIRLDRLHGVHPVAGVHCIAGVQQRAGVHGVAGLHHGAQGAAPQCVDPLHHSAPEPSLNHHEPSVMSTTKPPTSVWPSCPHQEIINLYHKLLPELPPVKVLDAKGRKAKITECWKWVLSSTKADGKRRATSVDDALTWFSEYFERTRLNDFLMGRTQRSAEHQGWRCTLDYLLTEKGRLQVIERTEVAA